MLSILFAASDGCYRMPLLKVIRPAECFPGVCWPFLFRCFWPVTIAAAVILLDLRPGVYRLSE